MIRLLAPALLALSCTPPLMAQEAEVPLFGQSERPSQAARTSGLNGTAWPWRDLGQTGKPPAETPEDAKDAKPESELEFGGEIYFGLAFQL